MTNPLYTRLAATADRLLTSYAQGDVVSVTFSETGGDEFNPPTLTDVPVACKGVASGVSEKYVDGTTVEASDIMVTILPISPTPKRGGVVKIDGKSHTIKRIMPTPAAGDPIILKLIVG